MYDKRNFHVKKCKQFLNNREVVVSLYFTFLEFKLDINCNDDGLSLIL